MTNLDVAFNYLLQDEGSRYTNDPRDSGGPTKYGITKKTYEEFFGLRDVTASEIEDLTADIAKRIYAGLYWSRLNCGRITDLSMAVAIFDSSVLYGVGTIGLLTQRALSLCAATLKLDGILGDKSIEIINLMTGGGLQTAERRSLTNVFYGLLLRHIDAVIVANPTDEIYRHGWTLRADRIFRMLNDPDTLNRFKENI